jgi:hypothetical protein
MPITVSCPECRAAYDLADHLGGKRVVCASCGQPFAVPAAPAPTGGVPVADADGGIQTEPGLVPPAPERRADDDRIERHPRLPPGNKEVARRRAPAAPDRPPARRAGAGRVVLIVVGLIALLRCAGNLGVLFRSKPPDPPRRDQFAGRVAADRGAKPLQPPRRLQPVASTGWATVRGRVTLEGNPPDVAALDRELLAKMDANQDRKHCLAGASEAEKSQQTWRVGKDRGVCNVFVWLAPPEGRCFPIDWDRKPWPKEVVIDQPHCAFVPHAAVLFPGAYEDDPDALKPSGQVLVVKNSAPMNHNTMWRGGDANPGDNKTLPAGARMDVRMNPDGTPVRLRCNIHTFMTAVVRVFDHPYATVTDADGNYEIKNVPAGAELSIVVWHEEGGYGNKGKEGEKVTLDAGKANVYDYTVRAR